MYTLRPVYTRRKPFTLFFSTRNLFYPATASQYVKLRLRKKIKTLVVIDTGHIEGGARITGDIRVTLTSC